MGRSDRTKTSWCWNKMKLMLEQEKWMLEQEKWMLEQREADVGTKRSWCWNKEKWMLEQREVDVGRKRSGCWKKKLMQEQREADVGTKISWCWYQEMRETRSKTMEKPIAKLKTQFRQMWNPLAWVSFTDYKKLALSLLLTHRFLHAFFKVHTDLLKELINGGLTIGELLEFAWNHVKDVVEPFLLHRCHWCTLHTLLEELIVELNTTNTQYKPTLVHIYSSSSSSLT